MDVDDDDLVEEPDVPELLLDDFDCDLFFFPAILDIKSFNVVGIFLDWIAEDSDLVSMCFKFVVSEMEWAGLREDLSLAVCDISTWVCISVA